MADQEQLVAPVRLGGRDVRSDDFGIVPAGATCTVKADGTGEGAMSGTWADATAAPPSSMPAASLRVSTDPIATRLALGTILQAADASGDGLSGLITTEDPTRWTSSRRPL